MFPSEKKCLHVFAQFSGFPRLPSFQDLPRKPRTGKPRRLIITVRKLGFWDQASGSKKKNVDVNAASYLRFSSHVWWYRNFPSNSEQFWISRDFNGELKGGTSSFLWKPFPLVENLTSSGWWFQPLWQIWKSVGMMTFPIDGKIKVMFQTTNQSFFISCSSPRGLFLSPRREQYSEDHPGSSKWLVTLITLVSKSPFMGLPHIYIYHIIYDLYIYIIVIK